MGGEAHRREEGMRDRKESGGVRLRTEQGMLWGQGREEDAVLETMPTRPRRVTNAHCEGWRARCVPRFTLLTQTPWQANTRPKSQLL